MERIDTTNQLDSFKPKYQDESEAIIPPYKAFDYLMDSSHFVSYTTSSVTSDYINYKSQYKLVYFVIIPDDSKKSEDYFKLTLTSIDQCAEELAAIGIERRQIAVCAFLLQINNKETMKMFSLEVAEYNNYSPESFCCKFMKTNREPNALNLYFNYKESMTPIQAIRCFHSRIVEDLNGNELFAIVTESGVEFPPNAVRRMMTATNATDNQPIRRAAVVPALESLGTTLFGRIQKYENVHYNMFDLHYYSIASSVPVISKFNLLRITENIKKHLRGFYSEIPIDASLSYHDYKLGLFLQEEGFDVLYVPTVTVTITENDLEFPTFMENYSLKNQGNLAIFFDLCKSFASCRLCTCNKAMRKIMLFFQIIGIITEFIFPSLMAEVMYAIFFDAFGVSGYQAAIFFTVFYILLIILAGIYGLMSPKLTGQYRINFIAFFFVFDAYYLFILISSVIAMDNINRIPIDNYAFNFAALFLLIIINFVLGIAPLFLNFKKVIQNCADLVIYFFLGSPNYTSLFAIHSLFNASDSRGNRDNTNHKAIFLLLFILINAFFGFLIFAMTNRPSRVAAVLALSIIFTIYNSLKMISIIVSKLCFTDGYERIMDNPRDQVKINNKVSSNVQNQAEISSGIHDNPNLDELKEKIKYQKNYEVNDYNNDNNDNNSNIYKKPKHENLESNSPNHFNDSYNSQKKSTSNYDNNKSDSKGNEMNNDDIVLDLEVDKGYPTKVGDESNDNNNKYNNEDNEYK